MTFMSLMAAAETILPTKSFAPRNGELRATTSPPCDDGSHKLAGAMKTNGKRVEGGWVLNGQKTWCSSSHVADYIRVHELYQV